MQYWAMEIFPRFDNKSRNHQEYNLLPWLVWLSGLSVSLLAERSPVQFPVKAHAWVASQGPTN